MHLLFYCAPKRAGMDCYVPFFDDDILYTRTTHPKKLTPKNFT